MRRTDGSWNWGGRLLLLAMMTLPWAMGGCSGEETPGTAPAGDDPATVAASAAPTEVIRESRVLEFPEKTMGELFARPAGRIDKNFTESLGPAKGRVTIPAGRDLMLRADMVNARDLSPLAAFPPETFRSLNLTRVAAREEQLANIAHFTDLEFLTLNGMRIGDKGIEHLKNMDTLRYLNLNDTLVTDAALEHMKGMKKLELLDLGGTKVTAAGVEALQKELPLLTRVTLPKDSVEIDPDKIIH